MNRQLLMNSRWLLLLLFPLGCWLTVDAFSGRWTYYVSLNMLSLLAGCAILYRLRGITPGNIPIWIIFSVLITGYYVKFYFFVHGFYNGAPTYELGLLLGNFAPRVATYRLLMECFEVISVAFIAFSVAVWFLLRDDRASPSPVELEQKAVKLSSVAMSRKLLMSAVLLAVISGFLRWYYQLGIPGSAELLPYKIAGAITVTNGFTVPVLIGIALIYAVRMEETQNIRIAMVTFLIWGAVHFLLFLSKTFLIVSILWIILVGVLTGRPLIRWRYLALFAGLLASFYPFLNIFRDLTYSGAGGTVISRFGDAINLGIEEARLIGQSSWLVWGGASVLSRVTGLDSLMIMTAIRPENNHYGILNYMLGNEFSAEQIITWFHKMEGTGVAQSLLGQAYFVTGSSLWVGAWVAGWAIFTFWVAKTFRNMDAPLAHGLWVAWLVSVLLWTIDGISYVKILVFGASIIPVILLVSVLDLGNMRRRGLTIDRVALDSDGG